ncbi:roquin-1 [Drosophila miranda]|uniref:roquin-1 n=1 Tax=Drosophila miranda TaxID=7229 RepID=UPI0007E7AFD8|nr:roquin-1 [Drosophila miranda]
MPIQAPSWTDFLNCPICGNEFAASQRFPISLGCGHTICKLCLTTLYNRQCPFDQTQIVTDIDNLPTNHALLQLVAKGPGPGLGPPGKDSVEPSVDFSQHAPPSVQKLDPEQLKCYKLGKQCIEDLALHLKSFLNLNNGNLLTRPMQRKLVTLVNCQLMEEEGRVRALRAARSLGERTVTELILQHQNPQQLSSNLWAAVRTRGCQFLGPAMQEEVLKLVLLALEEGSALSRKVLVMFVVQRLEPQFPQASKTSIGHVVQLLYRASCFKVSKREADSSLMQLKEEFRTYDALRREHDAQIVQIATEAGLRIAPEQWSSLLYGDVLHKSHMQSIIDKLQTPSSFAQSVQELVIALQRTSDPAKLSNLHNHLKYLANIDPCAEVAPWQDVAEALDAVRHSVVGLVNFLQHHGVRKTQDAIGSAGAAISNPKYKISLCRDLNVRRVCPRGASCTFAHSQEEVERYRARNRGKHIKTPLPGPPLMVGDDCQVLGVAPMMPMSPMHYMASPRGYLDPNANLPGLGLSPGATHPPQPPQLLHHPSIARQMNGLMVPGRFDPRFNYGPGQPIAQSRNPSPREYQASPGPVPVPGPPPPQQQQPQQRNLSNPPSFNSNLHKGYMLPADVFHPTAYGYGSEEKLGHPWEQHPYQQQQHQQQQQPQQQQQQPPPSSKPNPSRPLSILAATADTSFYEKKPPNNVSIDMDMAKPLASLVASGSGAGEAAGDVLDALPLFRRTNNQSHNHNHSHSHGHSQGQNNSSLLFFERSDSILNDDGSTFDMPTGSSMHSRYGPICPKNSAASNWNNWIMENDTSSDLGYAGYKADRNDNFNSHKSSQMWGRKPQLLSEDSFEGGIDSGMMLQLEKNLVDIVDPDDSGIKVD